MAIYHSEGINTKDGKKDCLNRNESRRPTEYSKQYSHNNNNSQRRKKIISKRACACVCGVFMYAYGCITGLECAIERPNCFVVFVRFYVYTYCIVLKHNHLYVYGLCSTSLSMVLLWTFFSLCVFTSLHSSLTLCCHSQRTKRTLEQTTTANLVEYYILFCLVLPVAAAAVAFAHSTHTNSLTCIETIRIILVWILFIFFAHTRAHTRTRIQSTVVHYSTIHSHSYSYSRAHMYSTHSYRCVSLRCVVNVCAGALMCSFICSLAYVCAFDIFRLFLLGFFISHPFSVFVWMCACVRVFVWKNNISKTEIHWGKQQKSRAYKWECGMIQGKPSKHNEWKSKKNKNYHLKRVFNSVCVVDIRFLLFFLCLSFSASWSLRISSHLLASPVLRLSSWLLSLLFCSSDNSVSFTLSIAACWCCFRTGFTFFWCPILKGNAREHGERMRENCCCWCCLQSLMRFKWYHEYHLGLIIILRFIFHSLFCTSRSPFRFCNWHINYADTSVSGDEGRERKTGKMWKNANKSMRLKAMYKLNNKRTYTQSALT